MRRGTTEAVMVSHGGAKARRACPKEHGSSRATLPMSRLSWQKMKLGEIGTVVTGMTPPTKHQAYYGDGYLFVTPSDLDFDSYFISKTERSVSKQGYEKYYKRFIPAMSTMYTCIGSTIGKIGISRGTVLTNQQINSIIPNDAHDARFVYYLMRSLTNEIRALNAGCAVPIINKGDFEDIDVPSVPLPVQRQIADILSAYDDLIENNRRRIVILEETARLAYRKWFGGGEGRLLPLAEVADVLYGKDHKKIQDGDIPIFGSGGIMRYGAKAIYEQPSVLIPRKGTISNVMYVEEPFWTVDTMFYTRVKIPNMERILYYQLCDYNIASMSTGAAVPSMTTAILNVLQIVVPPSELRQRFDEAVSPIFEQCRILKKQSAALAAARDMLLPRLMKGFTN